ncbi:MAG TPA: hypothetical protein PLQ11_06425 [Beijerinckiaceae bacterium]|nr:hypothetical protein [Beijerinckiaceae bacterium]
MVRYLAAGACLLSLFGGLAEARPMSSRMACSEVQRLVARSGAVVMSFTPTTYDRVVHDRRWCLPSEGLEQIYVPARDTPHCFAGYTCREADRMDW